MICGIGPGYGQLCDASGTVDNDVRCVTVIQDQDQDLITISSYSRVVHVSGNTEFIVVMDM